jgi:hypothetical protein
MLITWRKKTAEYKIAFHNCKQVSILTSIPKMPTICKYKKTEYPKNAQHVKDENVAGSVGLRLFMDDTGNCKLPSTNPDTKVLLKQYSTLNMIW